MKVKKKVVEIDVKRLYIYSFSKMKDKKNLALKTVFKLEKKVLKRR